MTNDSDKHYPLYDVALNLQTDCTREEAVAIMLGVINGPSALIHINPDQEQQCYLEGIDMDETYSLQDDLEEQRDSLVTDYNEARIDKLPEEVVTEKLAAIKDFDTNYVNKSRVYLCHIDDELAKGAESKLRLSQDKARGGQILLTLKSLDEWAGKEYGISIFKNLGSNTIREKKFPKDSPHEEEVDAKGRMSPKSANSLYTTFGFLVEAFVSANVAAKVSKYGTLDKLNVTSIASHLWDLALAANEAGSGQSSESIKTRIEKAICKKKEFLEDR
jgi:hypothetical protein